jgi:hypothetical protein
VNRLCAVLLAALACPAAADDGGDAKEALRLRLAEAMDAQPTLLHAMEFTVAGAGRDPERLAVEIFREGDRAGFRFMSDDSAVHALREMLGGTDGRVFVMRVNGTELVADMPGPRRWNERLAPFDRVRRSLGDGWAVPLGAPPQRTIFDLHADDKPDGARLSFGLRTSRVLEPAGWLDPKYLAEKTLTPDAGGTTALVRGRNVEGLVSLAHGLPVRWRGRKPRTGGTVSASAIEPTWNAERWRSEIGGLCAGREPNYWWFASIWDTGRTIPMMDMELGLLLGDAARAVPALPHEPEKLRRLADEVVAADLECEGIASVPPGISLEAWNGKVAERIRGFHQAIELGLGAKWGPWHREQLANLMVERLRETARALWRARGDSTR